MPSPQKILVFAHTPPPHHGQSYMVELMLKGLGGDWHQRIRSGKTSALPEDRHGIRCFHVNVRLSDDLEEVGSTQPKKILRLLKYVVQAVWFRFRYQIDTLYYVPAPAKLSAIIRDGIVMLLVRPFFKRVVFHWHAFGLGEWVKSNESDPDWKKGLTKYLLSNVDTSIVLTNYNASDARIFCPKSIALVSNGIPDPCPDFNERVLPERRRRMAGGQSARACKVLYLAHCIREKGLFDTLEAVRLANGGRSDSKFYLTVAGGFMNDEERRIFDRDVRAIREELGFLCVRHVGFLSGDEKFRALEEHDILCFPTYYSGEALPVNIVEAMAFGLPVVTTRWRGIPEVLPNDWQYLVDPQKPKEIAHALIQAREFDQFEKLRQTYRDRFSIDIHIENLAKALKEY